MAGADRISNPGRLTRLNYVHITCAWVYAYAQYSYPAFWSDVNPVRVITLLLSMTSLVPVSVLGSFWGYKDTHIILFWVTICSGLTGFQISSLIIHLPTKLAPNHSPPPYAIVVSNTSAASFPYQTKKVTLKRPLPRSITWLKPAQSRCIYPNRPPMVQRWSLPVT